MPKAVIFDVDGTLIDSVGHHARAWADAFAEFGHAVDVEAARAQIGKGGDKLLPVFLSQDEIAREGERLEARRAEILETRYLPDIAGFPGVPDLFRRLRADGRAVALASSAKGDELETYKRIAGIADLVETQTSSSDADASKPDPDIFQAALGRLGDPDPAEVVVVGDTPYDAQAAAGAGMRTVGLRSGGWSEADLRAAGCIAVYADPAELLTRYASSPLAEG